MELFFWKGPLFKYNFIYMGLITFAIKIFVLLLE